MGWVWKEEEEEDTNSVSSYTKRIVSTNCKTEEVEEGKFIRKCEKTEQLIKDFVGRPSEVVQSNKEYTEEDVTEQMVKGSSSIRSSEHGPFSFPGLRSDIEAIEKDIFSSMQHFFDAAEGMKNGFFGGVFRAPQLYDRESPSSHSTRRGIPIEGYPAKETPAKPGDGDGQFDVLGMAKDV